jgi:predicted membrane metal-binding protein
VKSSAVGVMHILMRTSSRSSIGQADAWQTTSRSFGLVSRERSQKVAGSFGNRRLDSFVFSAGNLVEHCRATLRERILRALPGKPYAGVIVALVVGDQRAIDQSDWSVFNRTGVNHLISIWRLR